MQDAQPQLIGREGELARLFDAARGARQGRPAFVLVTGEAGIGKTRLLRAVAEEASNIGLRALWGTAIESGQGIPYLPLIGPVREALLSLDRMAREPRRAGATTVGPRQWDGPLAAARTLRRALDGGTVTGGAAADGLSAGVDSAAVILALFEVIACVPTLLVVDDVHWADASTVTALDYMAHRASAEPLVVIAAARDEAPGAIDRLAIADGRRYARLPVARLSAADVRRQAAALLGVSVGPARGAELYRRTAGNPFFVEQLLADPARLPDPATPSAGPSAVPASLQALLIRRVADLEDAAGRALAALAVIGHAADTEALAEVADAPVDSIGTGVNAARRAGILVADELGVAFRHPLFAEVLEGELDGPTRRAFHARAAVVQARAGAQVAEVADHWWRSGDVLRAWSSALAAARESAHAFAFAEALLHLERALASWPDGEGGRADTLLEAARAAWHIGDPVRALSHAQEARALDPGRADTAVAIGGYAWDAGRRSEAIEAFAAATTMLSEDSPPLVRARAKWGTGRAAVASGDPDRATALGLEASREALEAGDLALASEGLALAGMSRGFAGALDGTHWLDEAVDLALRSGATFCTGHGFQFLVDLCALGGAVDDALDAAMRGIDACTRLGLARTHGSDLRGRAALLLTTRGRWDAAADVLGPADPRAFTDLAIALLAMRRGAFDEAEAALKRAATGGAIGGPGALGGWLELAAVELAWLRTDPAIAGLIETVPPVPGVWGADVRAWTARWQARVMGGSAELIEMAAAHPDARLAAALVAEVEAAMPPAGSGDAPSRVSTRAGSIRPRGAPADAWAAAADAWTEAGRPWEAAWARLSEAEALFTMRNTPGGKAALEDVLRVADDLGSAPLRAHAETLARRARIRLAQPGVRRTDPALPTPRELEVLVLVAAGMTNPQIADRLFLSPKTVGIHVSRLLSKLDAHTRGEAVAIARSRGLLG